MSARRLPPALVAISPGDLVERGGRGHDRCAAFLRALERAVASGLDALLVREANLSDRALLDLALRARTILRDDRWLGIHDRAHLVAASRADALHLGFRSLTPAVARTIVEPTVAIGFSAHAGDDESAWKTSDYLFFGPVLDAPSKHGLKDPVGFDGLQRATRSTSVPMWALGGLKPEHVVHVRASGARGIAVLSGIFGAEDPASSSAEYVHALQAR